MFSRSRSPFLTFLLSYHVRVTSKIEFNFRYRRSYCFLNFVTIYVIKVKESIADIPTELPCLGDLKNLDQLPMQDLLRNTDDCVLWIFTISPLSMFSRSGNPLLTFLLSCHVWGLRKSSLAYSSRDFQGQSNEVAQWECQQ